MFSRTLLCSLIFTSIVVLNSTAQTELYIPRDIKYAYDTNTRSFDGKPGPAYWRNFSSYHIKASIDPSTKILTGSENIIYENNSPDTLKKLVLKLYQNMNKKGSARNTDLPDDALTDGMIVTGLKIDNSEYDLDPAKKLTNIQGTNLIVNLTRPLFPHSKIEIDAEWHFKIPSSASPRMGYTDSASFFIGYWYPKIAVYDDINGWDFYSYDGEHEFYFEYSDFNVEITMPHDFMVWATGMCTNLNEILSDEILSRYKKALAADSIVKVISTVDLVRKNIFRERNKFNTWKFTANMVPDFAFGTSSYYVWQMTSVKMNGRKILVNTAFDPAEETYYEVIHFAKGTVEQFPAAPQGIPYPYNQITVFNGESGMEYPMIVNDAAFPNRVTDVYVTSHEITHTLFPFFVNMSETKYGWFDEGMAYLLPQKTQLSFDPSDHRVRAAKGYSRYAGAETDMPLMTPTFMLREPDLSMLSYYKSAIAFDMMKDILGDEMFTNCLREFIFRWNGKHPTPYDFFFTFNNVSGKNLDWFWQKWFFEKGFPDLAIKEVNHDNGKVKILIEKIGNYHVPVEIHLSDNDDRKEIIKETAEIWSNGDNEKWIEAEVNFEPDFIELGAPWIPDSNPADNKWNKKPGD